MSPPLQTTPPPIPPIEPTTPGGTTPGGGLPGGTPPLPSLSRAELDGFLAGIALRRGAQSGAAQVDAVLGQDPATLGQIQIQLVQIAMTLLPVGTLSPQQKAAYGARDTPLLPTYVVNVAEAQRLCEPAGVRFSVPPDRLQQLLDQKGAFSTFKLLGMQLTNLAMDQRALCGAFLGFLVDNVLEAVDRRYHDEQIEAKERERLLDDFAPALLSLDEVLRYPAERKAELGERREALHRSLTEAQADAQLAETTLKVRQELLVPRQELLQAARRHLERTGAAALAEAGAPGAALPPPTGSRRVPII